MNSCNFISHRPLSKNEPDLQMYLILQQDTESTWSNKWIEANKYNQLHYFVGMRVVWEVFHGSGKYFFIKILQHRKSRKDNSLLNIEMCEPHWIIIKWFLYCGWLYWGKRAWYFAFYKWKSNSCLKFEIIQCRKQNIFLVCDVTQTRSSNR